MLAQDRLDGQRPLLLGRGVFLEARHELVRRLDPVLREPRLQRRHGWPLDANLDVAVTDENGNVICYDVSWSDKLYCDWTPSWDGYFYVTVQNMGGSRNSYYLMTN